MLRQIKRQIKRKRKVVEARNQADTIIHTTEKNLKEHGSKISEADKKNIENGISDLRNTLKGTDAEEIKKKNSRLGSIFYETRRRNI